MKPLNKKSFTLIESLLAIVLIALIVTACYFSLVTSFTYLRRAMELRTAALILQEQVSTVRDLSFTEIQALSGTFSSSMMTRLKDAAGIRTKSQYNGLNNILKISFKLDWTTFEGTPATKTIVTLITEHGINKK